MALFGHTPTGVRRLYALVRMLPYESALATLLRAEQEKQAVEAKHGGRPVSWSDLARTLTAAKERK